MSNRILTIAPAGNEINSELGALLAIPVFRELCHENILDPGAENPELYNNTEFADELADVLKHLFKSKGPADSYKKPIHPHTLDALHKLGFDDPISIVKFNSWQCGNVFIPTFIGTIAEYVRQLKIENFTYTKSKGRWNLNLGKFASKFCAANALARSNGGPVILSERKFKLLDAPISNPSAYLRSLAEKYPAKNEWARTAINNSVRFA